MKQGDLLECRDCPAQVLWKRKLLPDDWIVVLDDPPYALCGRCQEGVRRLA